MNPRNNITKEQAQQVFWKLGDNFWKQIIDGRYIQFGPRVFDEGLHGNVKEPGFFASLKEGCKFASENLTEKLTVDFYKKLHKILCAHFNKDETNTIISANETGVFRHSHDSISCSYQIKVYGGFATLSKYCCFDLGATIDFLASDQSLTKELRNKKIKEVLEKQLNDYENEFHLSTDIVWKKWKNGILQVPNLFALSQKEYQSVKPWIKNWEEGWRNREKSLNDYVAEISKKLNIEKFLFLKFEEKNNCLNLSYAQFTQENYDKIAHIFFEDFNQQIEQAKTKDEKITIIADLFQKIEWLHPFVDGQGRTDLVLLAKLLTENGIHPAILREPYVSSMSTLSEWNASLLEGLELWEREVEKELEKKSTDLEKKKIELSTFPSTLFGSSQARVANVTNRQSEAKVLQPYSPHT